MRLKARADVDALANIKWQPSGLTVDDINPGGGWSFRNQATGFGQKSGQIHGKSISIEQGTQKPAPAHNLAQATPWRDRDSQPPLPANHGRNGGPCRSHSRR